MEIYIRCSDCAEKSHQSVPNGRIPDTVPCPKCGSNRKSAVIGGAKPDWFDLTDSEFLSRGK